MRVEKLDLKNFVRFPSLSIEFDRPVTAIVGDNGEGKSTVLDGIKTILRGTSRNLSRQQAKGLASWEAPDKGWRCDGTFRFGEAVGSIRRTATTLSAVDSEGVRHTVSQASIDEMVDPKVLGALLDVWAALDMAPEQRKALFYDLLSISMDGPSLEESGLVDPEIRTLAEAGQWKRAEALAAEKKRAVGRTLREKTTMLASHTRAMDEALDFTIAGAVTPAKDITSEHLDSARRAHRDAELQVGVLTDRIATLKAAEGTGANRLEEIENSLSGMESEEHYTDEAKKLRKSEEEMRSALEEARRAIAAAKAEIATLAAEEARLQEQVEMDRGAHDCSTCGDRHEWPETFDPKPLTDRLHAIEKEIGEQAGVRKGAEQYLDEWEPKTEAIARDAKQHEGDADVVRSLTREKEQLEAAEEPSLEGYHREAEECAELVGVLAPIIDRMTVTLASKVAIAELRDDVEALTHREESYKVQEHLCRPDGLMTLSLAGKMEPIRKRLEAISMRLFVREASLKGAIGINYITIDDECNIRCALHNGSIMPVESISHSSRWRASLAVADAIAWASGLKWLAIDETNVLDLHTRGAFLNAVLDLSSDYDQIILCLTTNDPDGPMQPDDDRVRVLWAKEGKLEAV